MFSFANQDSLYLLLLIIPLIVVLFLLARRAKGIKLKRYGDIAVLTPLMPNVSKYKHIIKISLQLVAVIFIIIMIARPRGGVKEEIVKTRGIEVMIALDVSNSMSATSNNDPNGISRLQRSKLILEKMINQLEDDKVGLIVFAGNAYTQLPMTSDFTSAKMFLSSINTNMVPTQGTAIGAAIKMAMNSFSPNEDTKKAIIVITDGENHEDNAVGIAKEAKEKGYIVNVIGVGTATGARIPINGSKEWLKDRSGNIVESKLNESMAKEIAAAGGGIYLSGNSNNVVSDLDDNLNELAKSEIENRIYSQHDEQFPIFAWLALIFLLLDLCVMDRKTPWLQGVNFFTREEKKSVEKVK